MEGKMKKLFSLEEKQKILEKLTVIKSVKQQQNMELVQQRSLLSNRTQPILKITSILMQLG
jgi:hypothetical protein